MPVRRSSRNGGAACCSCAPDAVQTPLVGELFWAVMDEISAQRIVLVAGKDWWPEVRGLLTRPGLP